MYVYRVVKFYIPLEAGLATQGILKINKISTTRMNLLNKTGLLLALGLIVLFTWDIYLYYRPRKAKEETEKNEQP